MKMGKNKLAPKLGVGFVMFIMVMSVFSGAISAVDLDIKATDSAIDARTKNTKNNKLDYFKATTSTKADNGISVLSYGYGGVDLKNQTKKVHVAISNSSGLGKFTMGGYYNGQWQNLLYGYSSYGSTSYLTVQVENATASVNYTNADYMMDQYVVEHVHGIGDDAVAMKWRLPGDIIIMQKIQLIHDFARIEIDATNEGSSTKKIGVRYYYDTQVAWSDDAPIYIPGEGVKTTQAEYINPTFTYWKGYDHPTEPTVVSEAKISGADATPPDKLQIDDYGGSQAWDNSVDPGDYFSDSAVLTYWNPTDVAPGQSKQVVTYYGIGAPVARGPFNISEIMVDRVDGNYCPGENVTIKVDVISIGKTHEGSVKIEVLDDGNALYSSLPKSTCVVLADDATTIVFNYPVKVDACNKRLNIKASLLNSSTLSLIDEMKKSAMIIVDQSCPECAIKPDLAVNEITWSPDIICDGDQVAVNATIVNTGTDNAADFYVRFEVDGNYIGRKLISCLPAGSNTTIIQNWLACAGSHNVTVHVDEYNAIIESNETNNEMTADLPFIQFPDLTVTNITWTPTDIVGGDTVTFTATVTNIGAGSTSNDFYVRFEVDGTQIGKAKVADGLDSGTSTEVTQSWTATWASTINVSVDEDDAVVESDETNNKMSKALPGLPFPDLIVTLLTWEPKENVNAGDPVTFTATIENTGGRFHSTMSKPLKIAFLINDEYVGSRNIVGGIRTGQPLNTTFTWSAQPGTNPEVCVVADYSNMIPESNENNNELCETLTLAIKSPDLTITQLTFEPTGSIFVGDTVQFRAEVANIGAGDYNGDFDIGFYVDDVYAGATHVANGVPAGENIFSTFNWTASSCSDPVIIAKADFFDTVHESDKGNNEKTATLPASIPYADLEITDINWSPGEDIKDRDPVTFNVTVKNRGSGNVITDFKVYFDIDGYFSRTNAISEGLAAGESKTTSFTWKATPGDGHNATAKADPDNVVPESDKANNERVQLLPFNVSLVEIFEVLVEPAEITTGIGGQTSCKIKINNYGSASGNFGITVSGLDSDWYILSETSVYLSAGQEGVIDLDVSVPEACENSGTFPLQVTVTSQETGITKQGSANLIVEPTPVIHNLQPKDGASLGSDDVTFSWDTYINATTKIYLKSEGETDYTTYTGAEGQIHTVIVSNLARNKNYSYYAESTSTCGTNTSSVRTFYIGNGICFTKDVYDFTVERDYNQRVTIGVRNTDNEYHELLVEVPTTYDDLVLGFVGAGSQDNIIPLNPGKSKDITLAVHLQDAMNEEYEFMANLTSSKGDETLTDTARIKIHVHVPRIDYEIEEIGVDEITLMKTFRLTNKGDPITDLTISVADNLKENAYIEPVIEHYRLDEGASIEFNVVPILSSPDFQPASPIPPVEGDISVNAAGIEAKKQVCFTVPEGKQPYKATVSSPGVIYLGHVKSYHCNNKPNIKFPFKIPPEIKDKVRDDPLIIKFSAPGWEVKPHDIYISINGHEVGSLINTIPEGYYKFDVDPSFLIYPERGVANNYIELHTVHQNGGHYLVSSDVEVRLNLENYETWVIASSQEEANQIAADNLPPGFYESPDSITIGEVEIASEAGGSAVLGVLGTSSATHEVYLGVKTTIQVTAKSRLYVWAEFSNGDKAVYLHEAGSTFSTSFYEGGWTPGNPSGNCIITIRAKGSGVKGEITQTVKIINPTKLEVEILEPKKSLTNILTVDDCYTIKAKVTRVDDTGKKYGPALSASVHADFSNGDKRMDLDHDGGGIYSGSWEPQNPSGSCTIEVTAKDPEGKLKYGRELRPGCDSITVVVKPKLEITAKIPMAIDPYWSFSWLNSWLDQGHYPKLYNPNEHFDSIRKHPIPIEITANRNAYVKIDISDFDGDKIFQWSGNLEKNAKREHKLDVTDLISHCDVKIKAKSYPLDPERWDVENNYKIRIYRSRYSITVKQPAPGNSKGKVAHSIDPIIPIIVDKRAQDAYSSAQSIGVTVVGGVISIGAGLALIPFTPVVAATSTIVIGGGVTGWQAYRAVIAVPPPGYKTGDLVYPYVWYEEPWIESLRSWHRTGGKQPYAKGWYGRVYGRKIRQIESDKPVIDKWSRSPFDTWFDRYWPWEKEAPPAPYDVYFCSPLSAKCNIISYVLEMRQHPEKYNKKLPEFKETEGAIQLQQRVRKKMQELLDLLHPHESRGSLGALSGSENDIPYIAATDRFSYRPDEPIKINTLVFEEGIPQVGASVYARIERPDGATDDLSLFDDGLHGDREANDGFYSNSYTERGLGLYNITVFISGRSQAGDPFNSTAPLFAVRIPHMAEFNNKYSDRGTDTDGNGLYDNLTIDVGISVTSAGSYGITGRLTDIDGNVIVDTYSSADLYTGNQTVQLNFDGTTIRRHGVDGPYNLTVTLSDLSQGYLLDYVDDGYTTSAYNYTDFEAPSAEFNDVFSDHGTDTDTDGKFDYLTVEAGVTVTTPGNYTLGGQLYDTDGNHIAASFNELHLESGDQTVELDVDGKNIRRHGVDGPYNLTGLILYDEAGKPIDYRRFACTTSAYSYTDFQPLPAQFNDNYSDQGNDTDSDSKYNYLTVKVGSVVTTPGNYAIQGQLYDADGDYIAWANNVLHLDPGDHMVELDFDGVAIYQHGVDGAYNATKLYLSNTDTNEVVDVAFDAYTTSAYSYTDFETPSALFNDNFSDSGTDADGNGLYDYLTVEVGVDVAEAANYHLEGRLENGTGNYIAYAYNSTSLDAGSQTVQLNFEGPAIRKHGMDGPYNVIDLKLCDESGETIDSLSDAHTTSVYNYTLFEGYPVDLSLLESDIAFTPETPTAGETVTITATIHNTGTNDVGSVVVVQFFDGDPNAGGDQIGCDQTVSSIPSGDAGSAQIYWTAIPGTHDIFVRVDPYDSIQEASENNNQAHKPIMIEPTYNQLPIASFTYSPLNPVANGTILFNASNSYDPAGFIVNYEWEFGDDIAATGEIVEHTYSKPGDYIVTLRVTDNASVSNTNTMILTITMVETAVCGDVTGDINVTMADARRIVMWLSYPEDYPIHNLWAADVTGDGTVTMADARRIVMWLSYPYQYPLTCSLP